MTSTITQWRLRLAKVKVLVVEDEVLYRQMLVTQLSAFDDVEVVGEAPSGQEAIELAEELSPEVVLMDIQLQDEINGIEAGQNIMTAAPTTGIVLLSMHADKQVLEATLGEGSSGWSYLLKTNVRDADTLARAIRGSAWGMVVVDPELTEGLQAREDTPLGRLTNEQLKLLELVAQGYTDAAIASKLRYGAVSAVGQHLTAIYEALDITSDGDVNPRVKAVVTYLEQTRRS